MMNVIKKNYLHYREDFNLWIGIFILSIISLILLLIFSSMSLIEILRIVYGTIFVLFLPGFVITFSFFTKEEVDILEKIALSFALSIAIIPLITFYLNFIFDVKINALNIVLTIVGIILLTLFLKSQEMWFVEKGEKLDNFIDEKIIKKSKLLSKIFKE